MKGRRSLWLMGMLLVFALSCGKATETRTEEPAEELSGPSVEFPVDNPADYFPMDVGREWSYLITIGETEPLIYQEVVWPTSTGSVLSSTRGRLALASREGDTFLLELRVKSRAVEQGPLSYPEGVELEILTDDLDFYEDSQQVFWAILTSPRYMTHEVVTFSQYGIRAPTGWPIQEDGFSMRLLFVGEEGVSVGMGEDPADEVMFIGVDTDVPGYEGKALLQFRRTVKEGEPMPGRPRDYLDSGFIENTWFAEGEGLVRLEQRVGGQVSMTWNLLSSE